MMTMCQKCGKVTQDNRVSQENDPVPLAAILRQKDDYKLKKRKKIKQRQEPPTTPTTHNLWLCVLGHHCRQKPMMQVVITTTKNESSLELSKSSQYHGTCQNMNVNSPHVKPKLTCYRFCRTPTIGNWKEWQGLDDMDEITLNIPGMSRETQQTIQVGSRF